MTVLLKLLFKLIFFFNKVSESVAFLCRIFLFFFILVLYLLAVILKINALLFYIVPRSIFLINVVLFESRLLPLRLRSD